MALPSLHAVPGHQGFRPKAPDGYRFLGRYFQAFPPVGATWPDRLIQAIRRDIDPEICPMWCVNVYRSTSGGILTIGRHWLWREIRDRRLETKPPRYIPAMTGLNRGRKPNEPLMALELDQTEQELEDNVAGGYLDFGWWIYNVLHAARQAYEPDADREMASRDERDARRAVASEKAIKERVDERFDGAEWAEFKKNCEKLTDAELSLIAQNGLFGLQQPYEARPTVDLGGRQ